MTTSTRPEGPPAPAAHPGVGRQAFLVAAGIFLSRIAGLVRDRIFAHYFGITYVADAFKAALRIPNTLQNLFGEGVLSASFIPVYAKLIAQKNREEAGRVAGAVFSLLALITSVLVLVGVLATPYIIDVIAFGFKGETRRLAIQLVRILFPGVGLLVMSAWCLGILNSHGKFFLSYVSPVLWNAAFIAAMLAFRGQDMSHLAVYTAWGSVVGSGLQFLVQLPMVLRLAPELRIFFSSLTDNVRVVIRNFVPVFFSRGVLQLSAYIDGLLASLLPVGGVSALANAQTLYTLPVSLFGMSISAAELPAMSSTLGTDEQVATTLRQRIAASTKRVGFFVVPSAVGFIALGDVITAAIYQTGKFSHADAIKVWTILAGSGVGLVASTVGRLYSSAYYALRDTRTPVRFGIVRVILTTVLGYLCSRPLPRLLGVDPFWGAAGLTASAGFAAWVEFVLLRRGMNLKIGRSEFPTSYFAKLWGAALIGAAVAWGVKLALHPQRPIIGGLLILVPYGAVYLGCTAMLGIEQASGLVRRVFSKPRA
ncbi:MAG TPA: murein biosynthesis integral membrane protein MurJ [Candidatus Polarisedimenticolia bacterium]|nr:murein biosynthesis integral membrane protein MurJ [Candidatus Polarisedimenticolia bacterium]